MGHPDKIVQLVIKMQEALVIKVQIQGSDENGEVIRLYGISKGESKESKEYEVAKERI